MGREIITQIKITSFLDPTIILTKRQIKEVYPEHQIDWT